MIATYLRIRNVMGLSEWELRPGGYTLIEGENATGKTSFLEAIKALYSTEDDPTLLTEGADKAEILLVFDEGKRLERTITSAGSITTWEEPGKKKTHPSQKILRALQDAVTLNPMKLIRMEEDELVGRLLEIMPMEVSKEELAKAVGCSVADLPTAGLKGDDALKDIAWLRKKVYDERTGINRAATEKRAHIGQLQQALPPKVKAADAETLVDQQIRLQQEEKQKQTGIQEDFNAAVEAAHTARAAALTELDAWYRPRREELAGKLAAARSLIEQNARADATLEAIKAGQKDIDKWDRLSERFTKALDSLDALRLSLFERLPVPGIELRDDGLYLDGVRWARQNTARKIAFALGVGVSRAERSEIKMICLDDAEHLDRKNLEALKKAALGLSEKGYQFFVSRVVLDGELTATTE